MLGYLERVLAAGLLLLFATLPALGQTKPAKDATDKMLSQVPELFIEPEFAKQIHAQAARELIAQAVTATNQVNNKNVDNFVTHLRGNRPDLGGLPFLMGKDCRMAEERFPHFADAGEGVHQALSFVKGRPDPGALLTDAFIVAFADAERKRAGLPDPEGVMSQVFLPRFLPVYKLQQNLARKNVEPEALRPTIAAAQTAALMQILGPEPTKLRVALANYLSRLDSATASRALAQLAIYSEEPEVRSAACKALKTRPGADYAAILVAGLSYPLPAVAERASEAIVQLKQTTLIPRLIDVLDRPDPRAPVAREVDGVQVEQVRELVRVNHHRNCLLCHPPGNTPDVPKEAIRAPIAVPGEPMSGHRGYGEPPPNPDHVVRIDVTYLRQDFSRHLSVANAAPWPEVQRFDFLVRTRTVSQKEAQDCRERVAPGKELSPYHRAAVAALRELTGRDAAPTAAAWRKVVN